MTLNFSKQWFIDRWAEKGLTLRKMAKMLDVDPSALSRTLNGERVMKIPEVGKIATIMEASREEVLAHIEARPLAGARSEGPREARKPGRHPGFGFMKGMVTFQKGFDVTRPFSDEARDEGYLGEGDRA